MGQPGLCDKGLVGRVVEEHRFLFQGVVHPGLELLPAVGRASGVVGGAQVDDVRLLVRVRQGEEPVLLSGVQVDDGPAVQQVGVHVHGVHRVGDEDGVLPVEEVQNVPQVAFGPLPHKDLCGVQVHPKILVVPGDGLPQKGVAVAVGGIAVEGLFPGLLLRRFVQRFDHRRGQGQGHVPNAHFYDLRLRVLPLVGRHLFRDGDEQVALPQALKILIELHGVPPFPGSVPTPPSQIPKTGGGAGWAGT